MTDIEYKGFVIRPAPEYLVDLKCWSVKVWLDRHSGDAVHMKHFTAKQTAATEEEAVAHSLEYGRQVIDGQITGVSENDLP